MKKKDDVDTSIYHTLEKRDPAVLWNRKIAGLEQSRLKHTKNVQH